MTYINPFEILGFIPSSSEDLAKAKAAKLADIKASETNTIDYVNRPIDLATFQQLMEELENPQKWKFHQFIYQQPLLLRFLKYGDVQFLGARLNQPIYQSRSFKTFIGKHFASSFQKSFEAASREQDVRAMQKLCRPHALLLPVYQQEIYRKVKDQIQLQINQLKRFYHELHFAPSGKISLSANAIVSKASKTWDLNLLNLLPIEFAAQRSELAKLWADLAYLIQTSFPASGRSYFPLIEKACQLKTDARTRQKVEADKAYLKKQYDREMEQADQVHIEAVRAMIRRLEGIRMGYAGTTASANGLEGLVHSYVDIDEVERLSFGPHNMQIHLQEELKRVALFVWEKYEDQEVFEAIMLFAYQINIGDGAYLPKGDDAVENMQLCLTLLRDHIQQHVQVGTEVIPAKQIYQLASSYLDQEMLIHLAQANAGAIRQQTFEMVLPILHHIRHRDTLSALKLQEKLESTCAYDPDWYDTFDLIGDQILEQMQQAKRSTSNVASTQSTSFQPVVKRHPLERVSVKQRLDDVRQNVMAYFFAGTAEGSMRIVSLGMIAGLVFLVGLSFNAVGKMLNEPVTQTASSVPAYRFEDETEKIIKELQKRKNEFKGIQLETGAMPFMECFGPGIAGSGAGNSITIRNDSPFDAVAALKMRDSVAIIRHAYVRKGEQITFYNIPEGEHRLKFYMGNDWANIKPNACNLHGAFYTKPHYRAMSRRSKPLVFGQGTTQYVRLTDENNWESRTFYGISARNFFSSQHYLKKH